MLVDLCAEVAVALAQPLERISVEMVFRSLYFFNRACEQSPELQLMPWMVEQQRSMGAGQSRASTTTTNGCQSP